MYEKELKRAERLLENEFGTEWKKIVQTLGVWDLTHCIGRDLTSFIAYPERGSGGSSNWQGNCSPEVIRQITQYVRECQTHRRKEDFLLLDPMCGSGTSGDVAADLGIQCVQYDLNPELPCGLMEQHFYNLDLLTMEGQKKEMETFIRSRGEELSMSTVNGDIILYNLLARFMKDKYPFLHSFRAIPEEVLVKKFRAWLLNHGYQITRKHHMKSMGKNLQEDAAPIKYLRLLLRYLEPEDKRSEWEKDVWKLENFGFEVRQNPIDVIRTIKFTGIIQETIREEVKRASYIRIKYLSVGSLQGEIRAVRRFSEFLAKRNPEIKSLGEVGRLNIEEYLTYINLERGQERNLKTEMANLKNMLQQVGKVIDKPKLGKLFIKQDMPKAPEVAFKIYSDEEIKRLNYYIVNMEEQVARALILHQMLGGRISDTLTLRTDCLYQENGHYIVRMYQVKTSYYEKPIPDDVAKLIQKSIEYTYERYGETEYVFVNESNPSLPFQYSMLKHRVYTLIHENDICKDNGERMGFATHLFRHCYGMKLVELHLDDAAIAHLLGHRGVNTVYRYRRASGKLLVKETEELRKTMDEILSEIIKEWDGYEQVFKNG